MSFWSIYKISHKVFLTLFVLICFCFTARSQEEFPQNYFLFPFNPGKVNFLSGSMGELRPNHFHGGIDVKTAAQIGLPILSSADGYISRIKVSSFGYGNVLYITHPNGFVTVYAHLDKFNKTIAEYVRKKQYEKKTFEIELLPKETDLQVQKGDIIGISGNTGSSGGPHLHYEIRDKQDRLYNPLLFGFKEVKDNIAPVFDKIALKTLSIRSRVNNEFGRSEFTCVRQGKNYTVPSKVKVYGDVGIELKAFDRMNTTHNMYGLTCIEVKVDNRETFYHNARSLLFEENKYINVHLDYETLMKKGRRFEKCYISDGDNLGTYSRKLGDGKISITDTLAHKIEITIYDALKNQSTLVFYLKGESPRPVKTLMVKPKKIPEVSSEIFENILKIRAFADTTVKAKLYTKSFNIPLQSQYIKDGQSVYLYDLRKGLPDSVVVGAKKQIFYFAALIPSGREYQFSHSRFKMNFSKECLFDTLYLQYRNTVDRAGQESFTINDATIPFFKNPEVSITPFGKLLDTNGVYVYNVTRGPKFEGGLWKSNAMVFYPRALGKFSLYRDGVGPVVKYINKIGNSVRLTIFDRNSGVKNFRASINGQWLLMNYDHKRNLLWSEQEDPSVKLQGEFILEVEDRAGNKTIFKKLII